MKRLTGMVVAMAITAGLCSRAVAGDINPPARNPTSPLTPTPCAGTWYECYGPAGTGDVVRIGTLYVAGKRDGAGCAEKGMKTWADAVAWARGLNWLGKTDWRLPSQNTQEDGELSSICAVKDTAPGFTCQPFIYWSSTEHDASRAWCVYFSSPGVYDYRKTNLNYVRAVRTVE